jgi:hypothetical protein
VSGGNQVRCGAGVVCQTFAPYIRSAAARRTRGSGVFFAKAEPIRNRNCDAFGIEALIGSTLFSIAGRFSP